MASTCGVRGVVWVGCGTVVVMWPGLGDRMAAWSVAGESPPALARLRFPLVPAPYEGRAWFLPAVGEWFRLRDTLDRRARERRWHEAAAGPGAGSGAATWGAADRRDEVGGRVRRGGSRRGRPAGRTSRGGGPGPAGRTSHGGGPGPAACHTTITATIRGGSAAA